MPSIRQNEIIGTLTKTSSTTVSLSSSRLNIGAVQYSVSSLFCSTSVVGPGGVESAVEPWKLYYVYAVVTTLGRVVQLIASTSATGPVGYPAYRLIGYFDTVAGSSINGAGNFVQGSIGDIKSAHMTESQFIAVNGPGWILADGRNVAGSAWATLQGATTIPDARGQVLRGKNNGRSDGAQNPDGDSALGAYQSDTYASHKHGITLSHEVNGGKDASGWPATDASGPVIFHDEFQPSGASSQTNGAGTPLHNSGGNETRMKNITVNHFIKVN
jgi:hypothetical protein